MVKSVCSIILSLVCVSAYAQFQKDVFRPKQNAVVRNIAGVEKTLAWTGGVNAPQFAMADVNRDGKPDLVVFERFYGVRTFLSNGAGGFVYDPKYEKPFHDHLKGIYKYTAITGYLKLIDYNKDGAPDMFTLGQGGYAVYIGYYDNFMLKFKYYKQLKYPDPGAPGKSINAYVEEFDIPGIVDIDDDGDMDLISFYVLGSTLTLYKNCQKERGLPVDSIELCVDDGCWGRTKQFFERTHALAEPCGNLYRTCPKPGRGQAKTTHIGNTLCFIDLDGDKDYDYFNGNTEYSDIQFLKNGKTEFFAKKDTITDQDTVWGANGRDVRVKSFPAAFALDIDADYDLDLIFAPNDNSTEDYRSITYYENTGNNVNPDYHFRSDTFLVDQMIDHGTAAYPIFYDYNRDGLKDLFVGSDGYFQYSLGFDYFRRSSIAYYENTSDQNGISFKLVTTNFLDLYSLDYQGASLAIGDLDNDTLDDLVVGHTDGTFSFFKNVADSANAIPKWQLSVAEMKDAASAQPMDVGFYAAPCIYDVDKDGKNDLISGNQIGYIYYYKNIGSQTGQALLKEVTNKLGGVTLFDSAYAYSVPYIGPTDDSGIDYLVVGTYMGDLFRFEGVQNGNPSVPYKMIDSNYSWINVRNRAAPAFANLDNDKDDMYELVIGNLLGGLNYYQQDFPVSISEMLAKNDINIVVYPNPADNKLTISWSSELVDKGDNINISIVSVTGQVMSILSVATDISEVNIDTTPFASGTYYCIVATKNGKTAKPVSILH